MTRRLPILLLLAAASFGLATLLQATDALESFTLRAIDRQFHWHSREDGTDPRVVIVAVDQRSIDWFDREGVHFPWPRSLYNPVVEYARGSGAKAVVFDVLFTNQSPYGPEVDQEFADAMRQTGGVWLAGLVEGACGSGLQPRPNGEAESDAPVKSRDCKPLPPEEMPASGLAYTGPLPEGLRRERIALPVEPLRSAAGVGFVNQRPEGDGVYRRVLPLLEIDGRMIPAAGLAPLLGGDSVEWLAEGGVRIGGRTLPTDADGALWLDFRGGASPFKTVSALDVIQSAVQAGEGKTPPIPPELFRDAYVFVAYTAPGLFDFKPTPLSASSPGVQVHAVLLTNTLDGSFMRPAAQALQWAAGALLALGVCAAVLLVPGYLGPVILPLTLLLGTGLLTQLQFERGVFWDLPYLLLIFVLSALAAGVQRYRSEGERSRFLRMAFAHYVSPDVVRQIIEAPERLALGGEKREITVLFSDLEGFTTLSERLEPQLLVRVLNEYTTLMTEIITGHHGTVDKFIGDAVMAFWGAPLDQPRQSELAIRAALECSRRFVEHFGPQYPDIHLAVRIGIDRGPCIVGNMGSSSRFDYTAIGDTVNQASRLEGLNKHYHTLLLVGEQAWQPLASDWLGRQIDYLKVKGKSQAVRVFEPFGLAVECGERERGRCEIYERAFAAYQAREWDRAEELLSGLLAGGKDPAAEVLLARVRAYRADPPGADWDGSFAHLSK